jgi:methyl-accepting chemotaxis protein
LSDRIGGAQRELDGVEAAWRGLVPLGSTAGARGLVRSDVDVRLDRLRDLIDPMVVEARAQARLEVANVQQRIDQEAKFIMGLGIVVLLCAAVVSTLGMLGGIGRPMRALTAQMRTVAGGDLAQRIVGQERQDEIGDLSRVLEVFRGQA